MAGATHTSGVFKPLFFICSRCLAASRSSTRGLTTLRKRYGAGTESRSMKPWAVTRRSYLPAARIDSARSSVARRYSSADAGSQTQPDYEQSDPKPPKHSKKTKSSKDKLVPTYPVRVRFAPSPTGYLHLGSLRTALFNYLIAKRTGGQFILRVEDTDQKRLVKDAQERLLEDLRWAGLQWDEGPEVGGPHAPYNQSQRTELYREHADQLLAKGAAYRCFCDSSTDSPDHADMSQIGASVGGCREDCSSLSAEVSSKRAADGERHVIRHGQPPLGLAWDDYVYGTIVSDKSNKVIPQRASIADVILLKSDGTPTYHLANVVDDHLMGITHVVRGTEWMSSTALHVALYKHFGWKLPKFAHVGLLTDENGAKLSKRNFDTDVRSFHQKHGVLPEALANFLVLLGWRNPGKSDTMNLKELSKIFDLTFTRGNTIVSLDKLWFLQRYHAKNRIDVACTRSKDNPDFDYLVDMVLRELGEQAQSPEMTEMLGSRDIRGYIAQALLADRSNFESPNQWVKRNKHFFSRGVPNLERHNDSNTFDDQIAAARELLSSEAVTTSFGLNQLDPADGTDTMWWKLSNGINTTVTNEINRICADRAADIPSGNDRKVKHNGLVKSMHAFFRRFLTYGANCPSTGLVMGVLGYEECKRRFEAFVEAYQNAS